MKESGIVLNLSLVTSCKATKAENPAVQSLYLPAAFISAKFSPVLMGCHHVVAAPGNDRVNSTLGKALPEGIAVVTTVADQSVRVFSRTTTVVCTGD